MRGIVPAVHDAFLHQLAQVALAHDGVRRCSGGQIRAASGTALPDTGWSMTHSYRGRWFSNSRLHRRVGDALDGVLNGVCKVVQRVDAPLVALAVVLDVLDAVDGRVAHIHVGAGQVDLGAQRLCRRLQTRPRACAGTDPGSPRGVRSRQGLGRAGLAGVLCRGTPASARGSGRPHRPCPPG